MVAARAELVTVVAAAEARAELVTVDSEWDNYTLAPTDSNTRYVVGRKFGT